MALTYSASAALMKDLTFIDRIKVACLKFADYILNESSATVAHSARRRWALQVTGAPDTTAQQLSPMVVMDAQVQLDGAAITDTALQTTVETVAQKLL